MRNFLAKVLIVIFVVAVLAEMVLRLTGKYATYSEANGGVYVSEYGQTLPTWYLICPPGSIITPPAAEFKYSYQVNADGIPDKEHTLTKPDSVLRIMVFGDSYTQGMGAPFDSTWPQLCQNYMRNHTGKPIEVISGAVAASDVYFNYVLHRDKLRKYKPDVIVVAVNITDYSDILLRGDTSRFKSDGTIQFAAGPRYEPVYAHSRLVRALFNRFGGFDLTGIFTSTNTYRQQLPAINHSITNLLKQQQQLAQHDSAHFVVLLHSIPQQFIYASTTVTALNTAALNSLSAMLQTNAIDVIDISRQLQQQLANKPPLYYTYRHDQHYNPTGYNLMAKLISDSLLVAIRFPAYFR